MIYLASSSPRRRVLLKKARLRFKTLSPAYHEKADSRVSVLTLTKRHALGKALSVAARVANGVVLGADTVVFDALRVIGKPRSMKHAEKMLLSLQGRRHTVITAVALVRFKGGLPAAKTVFADKTSVWLKRMSAGEIRSYQRRIGPLDKAGAYALQSRGPGVVARFRGSWTNAVGLPMEKLKIALRMLK